MAAPVIQTKGLTKAYGSGAKRTLALENLDLTIQPGEIFGYLGPNGAGKTTTIRLLLDFIRPDAGNATIFGQDVRANSVELHRRIGYLPGELNLWKNQKAGRIVQYFANVRGMPDASYAHELANRLKLDLSKKVRDFSTGNKRKLGIVIALMHKPELLILDEPTSGLDPLMQQTFNQLMHEVRAEGRTVFLSSHVLSEVQAICDRVAILRDGRLRAVETVEKLTHVDFRWVTINFRDAVPAAVSSTLSHLEGASNFSQNGKSVRLQLTGDFDPIIRALDSGYITDLRVQEPSLEEIFLAYYGNGSAVNVRQEV
jgi:ABC-2 type transport system ATP-binding protein